MVGNQRNILPVFHQGRKLNGKDIQPVVKIFPELAPFDFFIQDLVCRGNDAHIYLYRSGITQRLYFFFLQHPEQFCLDRRTHVSDFIQKYRPGMGFLKQPGPVLCGMGEGAFLISEKLAFKDVFRNGGTVHRYVRTVAPVAQ